MMELPLTGLMGGSGVAVDGHLRLFGGVVVIALFAAYGVLLWAMRSTRATRPPRVPHDTSKRHLDRAA